MTNKVEGPLLVSLVLALLVVGSAAEVWAQAGLERDIDLATSRTVPGPDGVLSAEGTALTRPGGVTLGATLRWTDQPLVLRDESGDTAASLVAGRLGLDVDLAVGVLSWLELGLSLPTVLYQHGETDLPSGQLRSLSVAGTGDLRLRAKGVIFSSADDGFGLGFVLEGVFPTALGESFLGDGGVGLEALIVGDVRFFGWHLALVLGYRMRPERHFGDLDVDDQLLWRLALRVPLPRGYGALFGMSGAHGLLGPDGPFGAQDENPVIAQLGLDIPVPQGLQVTVGGGFGVTSGFGAPRFDLFASIRAHPRDRDTDTDELPDHLDQCPTVPEDLDGFQDGDGCPDEDNDNDGVLDFIDGCPNEAEDRDGLQDDDGCPEDNTDGDQVGDSEDQCPDQVEDLDGFQDGDGCPDPDNDRDGIDDPIDQCLDEPEDRDGFQDGDGCPDPDNDMDGVEDRNDRCPNDPEDLDGFQDEDGCPDPDNDQDGVIDVQDRCPTEAEDDDDFEDEDGCPDQGGRPLATSPR